MLCFFFYLCHLRNLWIGSLKIFGERRAGVVIIELATEKKPVGWGESSNPIGGRLGSTDGIRGGAPSYAVDKSSFANNRNKQRGPKCG
jgi:hypothetical protein